MSENETRVDLVEHLFHGTGDSYDEIVHLATWGRDKAWKEELISFISEPGRILDLACGTGILSLDMARRFNCHVTGVELRDEYLQVCRSEAAKDGLDTRFILSPAEDVLLDEEFDYITSCYIPKYADLDRLVPNMVKMLAPGGLFIMQDFAFPSEPGVQKLYWRHFQRIKERTENLPDWNTMWDRLPLVIEKSTWIADLSRLMEAEGLEDVKVVEQSWGMSALVMGRKPE